MDNIDLRPGERLDDLQYRGLKIIQDPAGFCFGSDAVLLASFSSVRPGGSVLDLGTGTGILLLLLSARTKASRLVGLEVQHAVAERARRSVAWNGLTERIKIMEGDLKCAKSLFCPNSFDLVVCNPPYGKAGHSFSGDSSERNIARHEVLCTLKDCVQAAAWAVKASGRVCFVIPPLRFAELLALFEAHRLTPKRLRTVQARPQDSPSVILVEGRKGAKPGLSWGPPILLLETQGMTEQARRLYHMEP